MNTLLTEQNGERKQLTTLDTEDKEDLFGSLETIEKRSKGLLRFVNAYKDLTKTPELTFVEVDVLQTIKRVLDLLKAELRNCEIIITKSGSDSLPALADAGWLEQVLINIFKNTIDSLEGRANPKISISAFQTSRSTLIKVEDNGIGMDRDTLDKAFIPFFTTKKNGNGIGLSLSRQIMKLHKGTLSITSEYEKGTVVQLEW
jgi:signal transduction histidine kinase